MILDELILENFGAYGGRQEALLAPEKDRPVVLFGGMNGGGKTTFLDALQLALYGRKAKLSNRGRLAYPQYLRECIHRDADPGEGAGITLRFRRMVDGQTRHFEIQRSWREGVKGIEETVRVYRDGERDDVLTDHWEEIIEAYLPVGISNLFFFDGEQIKELAEGENASAILGTAIRSLLGLDLVDRLEGDLRVFERRKKAESLDAEAARQVEEAQRELAEIDRHQETLATEEGRLVNEAGRLGKELLDKEDAFRREGGELFLKRKELEENLSELRKRKVSLEEGLRELTAGPLPLLLVDDLLGQVEEQARKETGIRHDRLLLKSMEERDEQLLKTWKEKKFPAAVLKQISASLASDRRKRESSAAEPTILDADDHLAVHVQHLRMRILPQASESAKELVANIRQLDERIVRVDREISRVPEEAKIAGFQAAVEESRRIHTAKMAELDRIRIRRDMLVRQRQEVLARLDRLGDRALEARVAEDDRQRMLKHSKRVRNTLTEFRTRVIRRHVANIEALMLESFRQLLRKGNLVHGLSIDPESFAVTLSDKNARPLPFDRLSAGERQLLATAMLWGLARASGRPVPAVIDTPLGRLDSSHRKHLVERYFPFASHQVLLLSTDEEIVGRYQKALSPFIARTYLLAHDEALGRTQIEKGYFCHELAR